MIGARRRHEETFVIGVSGAEARDEFRPDFIGSLRDRRAEDNVDIGTLGTKPFHALQGRFDHTIESAFPAGMSSADHPCPRIGKQ